MYAIEPKFSHPSDVGPRHRLNRAQITDDGRLEFVRTAGYSHADNPNQVSFPAWVMALIGAPGPVHLRPQQLSVWVLEPEDTILLAPGGSDKADATVRSGSARNDSYLYSLGGTYKELTGSALPRTLIADIDLHDPSSGLHLRAAESQDEDLVDGDDTVFAREALRITHAAGALPDE